MSTKQDFKSQKNPDHDYINLLSKVDFNPIFIMGDHRSGTTLLYQLLTASDLFNFITAYHVIKYHEILSNYINQSEEKAHQKLSEQLVLLDLTDRKIDHVLVTPNLPEEYGFILKNISLKSYINPENIHVFQELCRKIQFISSNPSQPLLLKNPWCFTHFVYIKRVLPKAKFIFIHRHPIHVINSKLKAARSLLSEWNPYTALLSQEYQEIFGNPIKLTLYQLLYSKYFNLGLRQVTKSAIQSTNYFLENINVLDSTNYVSVKFEDLCASPKQTIDKILGCLRLDPKSTLDYQSFIQARPVQLLPEVQANAGKLRQKLQPYFTYHGYQ